MTGFSRFIRRLMSALLRLVVVLVILELAVDVHFWWQGFATARTSDPETGWRMRSNSRRVYGGNEGPYLLETNSKGFRDDEYEYNRRDDTFRIVALGACETFGLGVDSNSIYADVLEELLPGTEVLNLSCAGYSADQQLVVLNREGLRCRPDLVVQFLAPQDAKAPFRSWVLGSGSKCFLTIEDNVVEWHEPREKVPLRILNSMHSLLLLGKVLPLIEWLSPTQWLMEGSFRLHNWPDSLQAHPLPEPSKRYKVLRQLLLNTRDICQSQGIDYVAVYYPGPSNVAALIEHGDRGLHLIPTLLRDMQKEYSFPALELSSVMLHVQQDPSQPSPFFEDRLSVYGHRVVAEQVAQYLTQQGSHRLTAKAP